MSDEFLDEFIAESMDHLTKAESILLAIDPDKAVDLEQINACFRALHTIKGGAGFLELGKIQRIAHAGEQVLDALRTNKLTLSHGVRDALLTTLTHLRQHLHTAVGRAMTVRLEQDDTVHIAGLDALLKLVHAGSRPPSERRASDSQALVRNGQTEPEATPPGQPMDTTRQIQALVGELISLDPSDRESVAKVVNGLLVLIPGTPWAAAADPLLGQIRLLAGELAKPGGLGPARFARLLDLAGEVGRMSESDGRSPCPMPAVHDLHPGVPPPSLPVHAPTPTGLPVTSTPISNDALADFVAESLELLQGAEEAALRGAFDEDCINLVFRSFHTIKGMASYLNQPVVEQLAHGIESQLIPLRDGRRPATEADRVFILESVDRLRAKVQGQARTTERTRQDRSESERISFGTDRVETDTERQRLGDLLVNEGIPRVVVEIAEAAKNPHERLGETLVRTGQATSQQVEHALQQQAAKQGVESFSRVATSKVEDLMNLVGELLISQSIIANDAGIAPGSRLWQEVSRQSRTLRELQSLALSLRMVPLKGTFQRLARAVHDTARKVGKEIDFQVHGEDTEIDRILAESIADPLLHMVRNGVDHGVESTELRQSRGKPAKGLLRLDAYHAGDNVVIRLQDDGGGMDPDRLRRKAVEKGLLPADRQLTREECFQLIFLPGFSTAEQVTGISGRGVGMDVVNRSVHQAGGSIEIASDLGKGTTFLISLPLTTAILDAMLLTTGNQRFLMPIHAIVEAVRPTRAQAQSILGQDRVIESRGQTLPIVHLGRQFALDQAISDPSESILLVVESAKGGYALQVDQILGQRQVVIKPLATMDHHAGVSGTAILGDGRVGLILDPTKLI